MCIFPSIILMRKQYNCLIQKTVIRMCEVLAHTQYKKHHVASITSEYCSPYLHQQSSHSRTI